ncbi:MAG: rRNA methyltransferase [Gammaproteobacteria bacterium]|jgi:16S rRNA (cytosine1402-N4)-methyltransferase|nr:rRNA methyltransferase [Gammaproteobacteria bacterium]
MTNCYRAKKSLVENINLEQVEHKPVLLKEVLTQLAIKPDGKYIDCTFGRGGHSRAILECLGKKGQLFAMDRDETAISAATENPLFQDERFSIAKGSFSTLYQHVEKKGWVGKVNGILMDVGVSSPQLDDPRRGFSFLSEGPLDMRMDSAQTLKAADWVNRAEEKEISYVLKTYGEERYHRRISNAIIKAREQAAITTTTQLADIVSKAHPNWERHKHPATRAFQAIRILINAELEELEKTLEASIEILAPQGRLLIISFHSLEHRIVKQFMNKYSKSDLPRHLPVKQADLELQLKIKRVNGTITATDEELAENPRARSAALRVMEKRL